MAGLCRWLWVCVSLWAHVCARAGTCVHERGLASPALLYNPMLHLSLWTRGLLVDCMCQTLDNYTDCCTRTLPLWFWGVRNNFRKIKRNWALREKQFSTVLIMRLIAVKLLLFYFCRVFKAFYLNLSSSYNHESSSWRTKNEDFIWNHIRTVGSLDAQLLL